MPKAALTAAETTRAADLLAAVDFRKGKGLVPVVVQERRTGGVLMLAYANRQALDKTLRTGLAHYYSRSRRKLWLKGESSGHVQRIEEVRLDCDGDTLLYVVDQKGPACHEGFRSCFFRRADLPAPQAEAARQAGLPAGAAPAGGAWRIVGRRLKSPERIYGGRGG